MTRTLATLAALSVAIGSISATAQVPDIQVPNAHALDGQVPNTPLPPQSYTQPRNNGRVQPYAHGHLLDHDYWHDNFHTPDDFHTPNVAQLDDYADQLAKVARHLHEDAHKLSQDYEHSELIEHYVDSIDRLQQHMHTILHEAVEAGTQSTTLTDHIKSDVREVKELLNRLSAELRHQGYDGARTSDYYAMVHMRRIIAQEAYPLIRNTEVVLYGYELRDPHTSLHRRPINSHGWIRTAIPYRH